MPRISRLTGCLRRHLPQPSQRMFSSNRSLSNRSLQEIFFSSINRSSDLKKCWVDSGVPFLNKENAIQYFRETKEPDSEIIIQKVFLSFHEKRNQPFFIFRSPESGEIQSKTVNSTSTEGIEKEIKDLKETLTNRYWNSLQKVKDVLSDYFVVNNQPNHIGLWHGEPLYQLRLNPLNKDLEILYWDIKDHEYSSTATGGVGFEHIGKCIESIEKRLKQQRAQIFPHLESPEDQIKSFYDTHSFTPSQAAPAA